MTILCSLDLYVVQRLDLKLNQLKTNTETNSSIMSDT